jgi:hypothetical protein
MEIINKYYLSNTDWLAGKTCDVRCFCSFSGAHLTAWEFIEEHPEGVVERHICEHSTFKIWRAGDDFSTV